MSTSSLFLPLIGGAMIGLAAAALMLAGGRILGVSGIYSGLLAPKAGELGWRLAFVAGLVAGGAALFAGRPEWFATELNRSVLAMGLGGLLVGFGARLGSGCTSGHGVCGIARLGPRLLVATVTFMATGVATATLVRQMLGGAV